MTGAIAGQLRDVVAASDAYHRAVARALGLGVPETTILVDLGYDGPRTPSQLARRVGVTPASVTAQLDRLELAGHVVRRANPRDRRSVLVDLTARGRATAGRVVAVFTADIAAGTGGIDPPTVAELGRILDRVAHQLEQRAQDERALAADLAHTPPA